MQEALFTTLTNVSFNDETITALIGRVHAEKNRLSPGCSACGVPCGKAGDYDMSHMWSADEDTRSLKSLILFGMRGMAAYAYHAGVMGYSDERVNRYFYKGLFALGEDFSAEQMLALAMELGEVNLQCMALLDRANTENAGNSCPCRSFLSCQRRKKGRSSWSRATSLYDSRETAAGAAATEGKGVNVYTHGEMLPAHGYPELRRFPHLKGNFGTAWQNQQKEFAHLPAPILFTSNCLMPVKESYADRVFTTEVVSYPGLCHIGREDFTPVIQKAVMLGGFSEDRQFTGINGGQSVTTGFGRGAVLAAAGPIVEAVKSGAIRHFFLVGGCDGARPGRRYYTDFVKQTPRDTVILTLACGKFRFNDLDLGTVAGLPRLLDMGQCNDAYGAGSRWRWLWPTPSAAASTTYRCPWCCPGMSRRPPAYSDAAAPGHSEHPPRPHAAGVALPQGAGTAGRTVPHCAHHNT